MHQFEYYHRGVLVLLCVCLRKAQDKLRDFVTLPTGRQVRGKNCETAIATKAPRLKVSQRNSNRSFTFFQQ